MSFSPTTQGHNQSPNNDLNTTDITPATTHQKYQKVPDSTTFSNHQNPTNLHNPLSLLPPNTPHPGTPALGTPSPTPQSEIPNPQPPIPSPSIDRPPSPPDAQRLPSHLTRPLLQPFLNRKLTPAQIAAIPLIAAGKSDTAVAKIIGHHRQTINRWRLYDPLFISRLNRARAAHWSNTLDALRNALPTSVKVLTKALKSENPTTQTRAAIMLLKIAGTARLAPRIGPNTHLEALTNQIEHHRNFQLSKKERAQDTRMADWEIAEHYEYILNHIDHDPAEDLPPPKSPPQQPTTNG